MKTTAVSSRRGFLKASLQLGSAAVAAFSRLGRWVAAQDSSKSAAPADIVKNVEQQILRRGGPGKTTWFHARACMIPGSPRPTALMTVQPIYGSDHFGQVHWMESADLGQTWTDPQPIPALGRHKVTDEMEEGVCDVVPEYHAPTRSVLAIGHNVFYRSKGFFRPQPPRWPVYVVRDAQGRWSEAKRLMWDDPRTTDIYSCGCAQRLTLPDGDVLVPLYFRPKDRPDAAVGTVQAAFDGRMLEIRRAGTELRLPVARGLLEPSLAQLDGRFYMTIRAEDNHGYVTTSRDGLQWEPITAWAWDNGEPLAMSTTQQRWLVHSDALYVVYTRKSEQNAQLFRWRTPLYMAMVDRARMRLIRATERIAVPMEGDPAGDPKRVPQLGNFHTVAASPEQSWVTVGAFDIATWQGNLQMGRVHWSRPNRLAPMR